MKKLLTFLGIISLVLVLSGCNGTATISFVEPSFVGLSIDGQNPNNGTELVTYYKEKNEPILVAIELSNPDSLEIRGVVIKDYTYGKSKFTEDSTASMIYFYLDPGDDIGLSTFDLSDIKFFDGADSRDAVVDANNNEFNVYVYKDVPIAARENYNLSQDKISIDFNITDTDVVIAEDSLIVELLNAGSVVTSKIVTAGFVSIEFDNLLTDKMYEIKVRADYNLDDNTGNHEEVTLFNGTFTTLSTSLPSAVLGTINIESNVLSVDVTFNDSDDVTTVGGVNVQLLKDGVVEEEVQITGATQNVVFDELFNTTEYEIRVISDYNLRDGGGVTTGRVLTASTVTTLSRSVPVPLIENVSVETNRILFDIIVEDDIENPIIDISTLQAKIYIEGNLSRTVDVIGDTVDIQIYDILSGKTIFIELVADYDLLDGKGIQYGQVIHTIEYDSLLNSKPIVSVGDILVTQGYVKVDFNIGDSDNTLTSSVVGILYENGIEVDRVLLNDDNSDFSFAYLVEFTKNYRVEVIADYNLRDGSGNKEDKILYVQALASLVPKAPASELQNITSTTEGFAFEVLVMDADGTLEDNSLSVFVYRNGVLEGSQALIVGLNTFNIDTLLSNNEYQIMVVGDYNILDGSGILEDQALVTQYISTLPKEFPELLISNPSETVDSVKVNINITDSSDVIEPGSISAVLYQNGVIVGVPYPLVVGLNADVEFTGILSETEYVIYIMVDYDLDDDQGVITDFRLGEIEITTVSKEEPYAEIKNIAGVVGTNESIKFDVIVTDLDSVIIPGTTKAVLYVGDVPTGHEELLNSGLNSGIQFDAVYSDQEFNIRIITDYNLNVGGANIVGVELAYDFVGTDSNEMVTGSIYSVETSIDSITFSTVIDDVSVVITGNLQAVLLLDGVETGDTLNLSTGDNPGLVFSGLNSDRQYTIKIVTDYSLRDFAGEVTGELLDEYTINTDDYSAPTGYVSNVVKTINSLTFTSVISDPDGTESGLTPFTAVLYLDGVATGQTQNIIVGENENIVFDTLFSGREYEIRLLATYNLNDGSGDITNEIIFASPYQTEARNAPVGTFSNVSVTETTLHLDFEYSDPDGTLIPLSLKAWLYNEDDVLVDTTSLYVDEVNFDISLLTANYAIKVCVTADYDLTTGYPAVDDGEIVCENLKTKTNVVPSVVISNPIVNQVTVTADIDVNDIDSVISGNLVAKLFDSENVLVDIQVINTGFNAVVFNATINQKELYNIVVSADYDLRDREGIVVDTIFGENVIMVFNKVLPQASIENIVNTVDQLDFDVTILDEYTTYIDNAKAILYLNGTEVDDFVLGVGVTHVMFDTLVSNANYEVKIVIDYNNDSGIGNVLGYFMVNQTIATLTKQVPELLITNPTETVDSVKVNLTVTDGSIVIEPGSLKAILYQNGVAIGIPYPLVTGLNSDVEFTGILSNTDYVIDVVVDYNLDDDEGIISNHSLGEIEITTIAKEDPTALLTNVSTVAGTNESIRFDVTVTDFDNVTIPGTLKAVLYIGDVPTGDFELLSKGLNPAVQFDGVYSDQEFNIRVETDYNLNEGGADVEGFVLAYDFAATGINEMVTGSIYAVTAGIDSISFSALIEDLDTVVTGNLKAVLLLGGVDTGLSLPLVEGTNTGLVFTGLISNSIYTVRIETDYSLRDSTGEVTGELLDDYTITTDDYSAPTGYVINVARTIDSISFSSVIGDSNGTAVGVNPFTAVLYLDDVATGHSQVVNVGETHNILFDNLFSGREYEIRLLATYNLHDGNGDLTNDIIYTGDFTTDYRNAPVGEFTNVLVTETTIHLDFSYYDTDETMTPLSLKAWLYDENDVLVSTKSLFVDEVNFDISFLPADYLIKVCVTADYDLSNGLPTVDDGIIVCSGPDAESELRTKINVVPTVIIDNSVVNQQTVTVDIDVDDVDSVISGNLVAKLYNSAHVLIDTQPINTGFNAVVFNATLVQRELYNIVVSADYDLRDRQGTVVDTIFGENVIMVFYKVIPQASITSIVKTVDQLDFDVTILDEYSTYIGNAKAILYLNGVEEDDFDLNVGLGVLGVTNVTFNTLVSDADYSVKVVIDYNNVTGNADVLEYVMVEQTISTIAKQVPTAVIDNEVITSSTIDVDILVSDIDSVIGANLRAVLYINNIPTLQTEPLVKDVLETVSFTVLYSDSVYEVRVLSNYDLNDGINVLTDAMIATNTYTTDSNAAPTGSFTSVVADESSITYSTVVVDVDGVIVTTKAVLIKNGIEVADFTLPNATHTGEAFIGLDSDTSYTIELRTEYNLLDGSPTSTVISLASNTVSTAINTVPSAFVGNAVVDTESITFDAIITDVDGVITGNLEAVLFLDGVPAGVPTITLSSLVDNEDMVFDNLYSESTYEVRIVTDYDINDGSGEELVYVLASLTASTSSKALPIAVISNDTVTNSVIEFDVTIQDPGSAVIGIPQAVLYKDDVATASVITLGVGTYIDQQFTGLEFGAEYEVKIETSYNYNIGDADVTGYVLTGLLTTTQALVQLDLLVTDVDQVNFDIILNDEFSILDNDNMYLYIFSEADNYAVAVASYAIEGSGSVDLLHFLNDHTYKLVVKADVTATATEDIVYEQEIVVPAKELPEVTIDVITITSTSINTNLNVTLPDDDGIIVADSVVAHLYQFDGTNWNEILAQSKSLLNAGQPDYVLDFTGLTGVETGNIYKITVTASVDFNDGVGVTTDYEIHTRTFIYTP